MIIMMIIIDDKLRGSSLVSKDLDNETLSPSPLKDFNASLNSFASLASSAESSASSSSSPTSRLESTMLALKDLQARVRRAQEARDDARRQRDNMRIEVILIILSFINTYTYTYTNR